MALILDFCFHREKFVIFISHVYHRPIELSSLGKDIGFGHRIFAGKTDPVLFKGIFSEKVYLYYNG
jgi:hypothetical protein